MSSRNCFFMVKARPARLTSASPCWFILSTSQVNCFATCCASAGDPMVTTPTVSGISEAALSTAVPPRLCPINIEGAISRDRITEAAATRSCTLEEKFVLAKSPSLLPNPVKSKRSTAYPSFTSDRAIRLAATLSLPQVKQ